MKTLKINLILFILMAVGVFAFSQCTKEKVKDGLQSQSNTKSLNQGISSQTDNSNGTGICTGNSNGTGTCTSMVLTAVIMGIPEQVI